MKLRDNLHAAAYYEQLLDELQEEIAECVGYIEDVEDVQARTAMRLRYVEGLNWPQVAYRMRGVSPDSVRVLVSRTERGGYERRRRG